MLIPPFNCHHPQIKFKRDTAQLQRQRDAFWQRIVKPISAAGYYFFTHPPTRNDFSHLHPTSKITNRRSTAAIPSKTLPAISCIALFDNFMQYLLTQEEYDALRKAGDDEKKRLHDTLQEVCTLVADHLPVEGYPTNGKPWGCIRTVKHEWYCDQCPVRNACPNQWKEWSK